jgi:hypothetical protein
MYKIRPRERCSSSGLMPFKPMRMAVSIAGHHASRMPDRLCVLGASVAAECR